MDGGFYVSALNAHCDEIDERVGAHFIRPSCANMMQQDLAPEDSPCGTPPKDVDLTSFQVGKTLVLQYAM
jgi:hypothetical protein